MVTGNDPKHSLAPLFASHPRNWRQNRYVYPVISRRSGGLSVGVNLNPDKACNFDCVYCQVDRTVPPTVRKVDVDVLRDELDHLVHLATSGELFDDPQFSHVPAQYRRFNDIAFSGDGEPTTSPQFPAAVRIAADIRRKYGLDDVKLVLITDSAYLTKPAVRDALAVMDANNGETWAKLDAGTEEYYQLVNRPNVPLQAVLDNILDAARVRPVVIQSLWMNVHGSPPPDPEVDAFARRLRAILDAGGRIKLVQMHTIARQTTEPWVTPLDDATLERLAARVRTIVAVPVKTYAA
ncbi:MAG: radical SAM protein [Planctomycetes bacterium]|nr:radical SAM protein [Planctomycetota bacterium]